MASSDKTAQGVSGGGCRLGAGRLVSRLALGVALLSAAGCRWIGDYPLLQTGSDGASNEASVTDGATRDRQATPEDGNRADVWRDLLGADDGRGPEDAARVDTRGEVGPAGEGGVALDGSRPDGGRRDALASDGPRDAARAEAGPVGDVGINRADGAPADTARPDVSASPACTPWQLALSAGASGTVSARAVAAPPLGTKSANGLAYVVAGTFSGTLKGPGTCGSVEYTSRGGDDIFIIGLDAHSKCLWLNTIGTPGADELYDVAIATDGQVAVAGQLGGVTRLDKSLALANAALAASSGFIAVYGADGAPVWSLQLQTLDGGGSGNGTGPGTSEVRSVAFASLPNAQLVEAPMLLFAAEYQGALEALAGGLQGDTTVSLGTTSGNMRSVAFGAIDLEVAASVGAGQGSAGAATIIPHRVVVTPDGTGDLRGPRIAFDEANNRIAVAASRSVAAKASYYLGAVLLQDSSWPTPGIGDGQDVTVALIDPGVAPPTFSSLTLSFPGDQSLIDLAVDPQGALYVLGTYDSALLLNLFALELGASAGLDAFVVKLSDGLVPLWAKGVGGLGADVPAALSWSPPGTAGQLHLSGGFRSSSSWKSTQLPLEATLFAVDPAGGTERAKGAYGALSGDSQAHDHAFDPLTTGVVLVGAFQGAGPMKTPSGTGLSGTGATTGFVLLACPTNR